MELDDTLENEKSKEITFWKVLSNSRVVFSVLACIMSMMSITFSEPIFALRIEDFGYDANASGFIFVALTIPYIFGCPLVSRIIKKYSKRGVMIIGFFLTGLVGTMFGPS